MLGKTYKSIKKTVGRRSLDDNELKTQVVESLINSRPLMYVLDDEESISHPLTPSHLISGHRISAMPNDEYFEIMGYPQCSYKTITLQAAAATVLKAVETRELHGKVCWW